MLTVSSLKTKEQINSETVRSVQKQMPGLVGVNKFRNSKEINSNRINSDICIPSLNFIKWKEKRKLKIKGRYPYLEQRL